MDKGDYYGPNQVNPESKMELLNMIIRELSEKSKDLPNDDSSNLSCETNLCFFKDLPIEFFLESDLFPDPRGIRSSIFCAIASCSALKKC